VYRLPPSLDPGFCPATRLAHQRKREGFGGTRGSKREEYQGREPVCFLWTAPFLLLSIRDGEGRCNSTNIPFAYAPFGVEVPEERMTCPPIFCSAKSATAHRYRHFDERINPLPCRSGNVGARHAVPRPRAMIALSQRRRRGAACCAPAETSGHGTPCRSGNVGARHATPRPRAMIALPQRQRDLHRLPGTGSE
jgi:hypothetical protein